MLINGEKEMKLAGEHGTAQSASNTVFADDGIQLVTVLNVERFRGTLLLPPHLNAMDPEQG